MNVRFTPPNDTAETTIGYVGSATECDPVKGGWYYDVDPAGGTPTKVIMCPATCTLFSQGGSIAIVVGCATLVRPPA